MSITIFKNVQSLNYFKFVLESEMFSSFQIDFTLWFISMMWFNFLKTRYELFVSRYLVFLLLLAVFRS